MKLLLQSDLHFHCHPATPCLCLVSTSFVDSAGAEDPLREWTRGKGPLSDLSGAPLCCWLWEPLQLDMSLEYNVGLLHDEVEELGGVSVVFIAITAAM